MSGRALYPVTMNLFDQAGARVRRRPAASPTRPAPMPSTSPTILVLRRAAGDGLLGPAEAGRLRPLRPVAGEPRGGHAGQRRCQPGRVRQGQAGERRSRPRPRRWRTRATRRSYSPYDLPKVASGLGLFDCVVAPCVEAVRRRPGRARVRLADRPGRVRPGAGGDPGPQSAAGRHRLRLHAAVPDALHAQRLRGVGGHPGAQARSPKNGAARGHISNRKMPQPAARWP